MNKSIESRNNSVKSGKSNGSKDKDKQKNKNITKNT